MDEKFFRYVRGIYSLGSGTPFYKHSRNDEVPWPHTRHPLSTLNPDQVHTWERVLGREGLKRELGRLTNLGTPVEEEYQGEILSTNIHKPRRTTYTTRIPYYSTPLKNGVVRFVDPEVSDKEGVYPPGKCLIHEIRILSRTDYRVEEVKLWIGGRLVQNFMELETGLISLLDGYMGCKHLVINKSSETKITTLPLYISRDHGYGLPLFVAGDILLEVTGQGNKDDLQVLVDLEILHTREEIERILKNHILQVEFINNPDQWKLANKWLYMPVCWREIIKEMGNKVDRIYMDYEGGRDEEIRGVFWDIGDENERNVSISIGYEYEEGGVLMFVDNISQNLISQLELYNRILPSMSGGTVKGGTVKGGMDRFGGFMFSKYVDQLDCEPGITPRNGKLFLEFSNKVSARIYLLTSKDLTI